MLSKNEIKDIQSLYHKKQRDLLGLYIAEGPKLAEELINTPNAIKKIYATRAWLNKHFTPSVPMQEITAIELDKVSQLQTPNQVVVIAHKQQPPSEPVFAQHLTLVLDGIQDPGNLGTIVRTADWFGISQIICTVDCADLYNAKVVQSTMGSIVRVQVWQKDLQLWKLPAGIPVYGAVLQGNNIYREAKPAEALIVIGNESKGIREPLLSAVTKPVTIPRVGSAESLNAAVATGIIIGWFMHRG